MGSLFGRQKADLPEDFIAIIKEAKAFLPHQPQEAFSALRPILHYPGQLDSKEKFIAGMQALAAVSNELGAHEIRRTAEFLSNNWDHPEALYDLGYRAYENRIFGVGATVLAKGRSLHPDNIAMLTELVTCLEELGLNKEAHDHLVEADVDTPVCHYLRGFHALMIGDVSAAEEALERVVPDGNESIQSMRDALEAMLGRTKALGPDLDVRGWHLALNGSLLLHLSPHGIDGSMNGRYAFVADSDGLCKEGLVLLKQALDKMSIEVPRVYKLPERSSEVLALAAAKFFGVDLVDWPGEEPGLIVAYDLDILSPDIVAELYEERPGRILWAHASNWTEPYPWAPDITTFLYQHNTTPWQEGRLLVDHESRETSMSEADEAPAQELADRLLECDAPVETHGGAESLLALCSKEIPKQFAPEWLGGSQGRELQRKGSPVGSSQFF